MVAPLTAGGGGYRLFWPAGLVMDDILWSQAIGVERHFYEYWSRQALQWTHDEQTLARLIHLGTLDGTAEDRPMDSSVRAMRHSAALADRLWSMLETVRARVHVFVLSLPFLY